MKIVFALRADAFSKPGGDSKKVERYQKGLSSLGWDSEIVTSAAQLAKTQSDLVHLMNLDTPRENLRYASVARKTQRPYVVSTIRHPFAGMESMYKHGDDRFYRALNRMSVDAEIGIGLREQVKLLKQKNIVAATIRGRYRSLQKSLVENAAVIFPMASGEAETLLQEFRTATPHRIVRNGFSFTPPAEGEPRRTFEFDLVSVGRIEPRKNSLMLAKAAAKSGLKTAFVGSLNANHKAYADDFLGQVRESDNLHYLGQQEHSAIMDILRRCDVYINPAWFEVVSQADVEAACMGLRIVSTRHSYLEDALGSNVQRFDPEDLVGDEAGSRLVELFTTATKAPRAHAREWHECAVELDRAYREVLNVS